MFHYTPNPKPAWTHQRTHKPRARNHTHTGVMITALLLHMGVCATAEEVPPPQQIKYSSNQAECLGLGYMV